MGFNFTDAKAITAALVSLVTAVVGLLVAFGIDMSTAKQAAITTFITVVTPLVLALIGLLHHSRAKVAAAALLATAGTNQTAQQAKQAMTNAKMALDS